jgi:hypothetical protein
VRKKKPAFWPRCFNDSAVHISIKVHIVSRKDFYESADIADIYRLESSIALAKDRKDGQVARKSGKPLL